MLKFGLIIKDDMGEVMEIIYTMDETYYISPLLTDDNSDYLTDDNGDKLYA